MDTVWQAEDSLREKKVESDLKDLLKTMVAFANSVAPGDTAQVYIGERDDGTVQGVTNSDNIQKSIKKSADEIYPEIYYRTEVYEREGKKCVRLEIKHNGLAPHFGGSAWVRRGSQTVKATEVLYQQMVELRQSKAQVMFQWVNKYITIHWINATRTEQRLNTLYQFGREEATLVSVNGHWATFRVHLANSGQSIDCSEPIEKLLLSWDDGNGRLKVEVHDRP